MALWISGGQVKAREVDGVTLNIRILPAKEMIEFLRRAETIQSDFGGDSLETFIDLIAQGLTGWSGDHAPEFSRAALEALSIGALQKVMETIIQTNTMSDTDRGNSHAS